MSLTRLIDFFRDEEQFPITVDDIRQWVLDNNFQDEIWFVKVDIDPQKLKSAIKQYTYNKVPYADPIRASNIYYSERLNVCWARFVCCKELTHIFDKDNAIAGTKEQISQLTFDLVSPLVPDKMTPQLIADCVAISRAICVLVPEKITERLRPAYESGDKTPYDIALYLRIPEVYIDFLFSQPFRAARGIFSN
jgi:hypothetical protein